ncbi:MAG: hypothetical protein ACOZHQ_10150 [Thermodesulfobacteriota bacterium]
MALTFRLADLVAGTLPAGFGFVGLIGLAPDGGGYHLLRPVETPLARALAASGLAGRLGIAGARPGWRYRALPTYALPATGPDRPAGHALAAARRRQAWRNGCELVAWARGLGCWAGLEPGDDGLASGRDSC